MVFLHSQGVSTSRAVRIYKTYGEKAIERVQADPYTLARDIHGIGFATADRIAQKIGIPHDSILRACAGLDHVLLEATGDGHCALPLDLLKEEAGKLLGWRRRLSRRPWNARWRANELVLESIGGQELVFLPSLKRAEENIALRIRQLCASPAGYPPIELEKAVAWCQQKTGKELAPSQREALRQALTTPRADYHRRAGRWQDDPGQRHPAHPARQEGALPICAPRPGARPSGFPRRPALRPGRSIGCSKSSPARAAFTRNESRPLDCDLLVVDETSMVDVPLMSHLLRAVPPRAACCWWATWTSCRRWGRAWCCMT